MNKKLYIAYGSNLNLEQMSKRCPTAKVVGISKIRGYKLLFRGPHAGSVATIEPVKGEVVPVLVWEITPADEAALDRYEGWPFLYRKETFKIKVNGKFVEAMAYIMNDGRPLGKPSHYYYKTILEGYKSAGFKEELLFKAMLDSMKEGQE